MPQCTRVKYVDSVLTRDKSFPGANGPMSFTQLMEQQKCKRFPLFSTVDTGLVLNAALEATRQWIGTGKAAAPTLGFDRNASGVVLRDGDGNARGGVRLAHFVAPTAYLSPNGDELGCILSGHHQDLTREELKKRYGTHDNYVSQVRSAMKLVREKGYVLSHDEEATAREAEVSDIAR